MNNKPFEDLVKTLMEDAKKGNFKLEQHDGYNWIQSPHQEMPLNKIKVEELIQHYLDKSDLAKQIWNVQPYFYDNSRMWWLWNNKEKKWDLIDETDILNMVSKKAIANTTKSNERNEIIEAMKQYGRTKIPQPIKKTWIQFKDTIIDIETDEEFIANPNYFVTNPIPFEMSKETFETPVMDRIFEEWVGKDYIQTLYEILAYCLIPDYPINRVFCFYGAGLNGKSKFLELLRKFIGKDNCCSTELDILMSSRFEITRLHKKLVCQMGETNFNEISKTSILKKLTGGDLIGFEYKNKNPFDETNYAKILISTNNLPTTTDKTIGFYRRWLIIDFPNTFNEKKDILQDIPEKEYNALAFKCMVLLKDLLKSREFHNEGSVEERMERYEARSNFLEKFLELFVEENVDGYITKADFYRKFVGWSEENKHRKLSERSVGLAMKKLNMESGVKRFEWMYDGKGGQAKCWMGIEWKE